MNYSDVIAYSSLVVEAFSCAQSTDIILATAANVTLTTIASPLASSDRCKTHSPPTDVMTWSVRKMAKCQSS